ncbi:MAG TPA: hypothetical protein VN643_10035 [Pyrinomonadaceae bacterium]|nr:hypothetical protein [Pyrinomonadaceae bacterium]
MRNTTSTSGLYLYHSFPRRFTSKPAEIRKAHDVLGCIIKFGLLLTPEIVTWTDAMHHSRELPDFSYIQLRTCFTQLKRPELAKHAQVFGRYSIEWPVESARIFGCIPVFYMPTSNETGTKTMANNAASLMHRLGELRHVLDQLAEIAEMNEEDPDAELTKHGERIGCNIRGAQSLIRSVFARCLSPGELALHLHALMGHFYPCDDEFRRGPMAYYQQREWRLVGMFRSRAHKKTRVMSVPRELKKKLLKLDKEFFGRTLTCGPYTFRTVDGSGVFKMAFGKHVLSYASRIICPDDQIAVVKRTLDRAKISVPVESLER